MASATGSNPSVIGDPIGVSGTGVETTTPTTTTDPSSLTPTPSSDTVTSLPGSTTSSSSGTTSTTGSSSTTAGPSQDPLSSIIFDERGNSWQVERFNTSGSVSQISRSDPLIATMCPQESLQQTALDDGSAIIFDLVRATLMLNTASDFELFIYAPFNATAEVQVVTDNDQTTIPISNSTQFSSCPFRLTRDNLGIASGSLVRNITLSSVEGSGFNGTSVWVFNSTLWHDGLPTSSTMPIGTGSSASADSSSGRNFDWAFVAIPLAIACALVLGLFVFLYESRRRRNGRDRDWFHNTFVPKPKPSPDAKFNEGSASTTLIVPPSALGLNTGFKFGSAGDKDPRALDRRSSSPLVGSPLLAMPSPVAWSPASPASAVSFSFQDPFADRHGTEGPIRDMGSLYAASEFIRSSSHDPSSRRTSAASLSQDLHQHSELRRGSAATSGRSSGYESYVTDQMTLVSPGGRRRSSVGSVLRKG